MRALLGQQLCPILYIIIFLWFRNKNQWAKSSILTIKTLEKSRQTLSEWLCGYLWQTFGSRYSKNRPSKICGRFCNTLTHLLIDLQFYSTRSAIKIYKNKICVGVGFSNYWNHKIVPDNEKVIKIITSGGQNNFLSSARQMFNSVITYTFWFFIGHSTTGELKYVANFEIKNTTPGYKNGVQLGDSYKNIRELN